MGREGGVSSLLASNILISIHSILNATNNHNVKIIFKIQYIYMRQNSADFHMNLLLM